MVFRYDLVVGEVWVVLPFQSAEDVCSDACPSFYAAPVVMLTVDLGQNMPSTSVAFKGYTCAGWFGHLLRLPHKCLHTNFSWSVHEWCWLLNWSLSPLRGADIPKVHKIQHLRLLSKIYGFVEMTSVIFHRAWGKITQHLSKYIVSLYCSSSGHSYYLFYRSWWKKYQPISMEMNINVVQHTIV